LFSGSSSNNIAIGFAAGPSTLTDESNKLYIASGSGTPLIKGDFAAKTVNISGSLIATSFTGSLLGTASFATQSTSASFATTASFYGGSVTSASYAATASNIQGGDTNYIPIWNTATSLSSSIIYQSGSNVGIGTTSPSYKLHIESGDVLVGQSVAKVSVGPQGTTGDVHFGASGLAAPSTGSQDYGFYAAHNAYRTSTGAWKHSRTSVVQAVRLLGTGPASSGNQGFSFDYSANVGTADITWTNLMQILPGGNVGIGTTSPTTKLHVTGITQIVESGNTAFYGGNYVRVFGDQNYGFRNTGGTYVANISMNGNSYFNGGNVGIGTTTPNAKLDISGSVNISGSGTQIPLQVSSGSTSLLFVSSSGNVGIGTTTPAYKLDVNGDTNITGTLTAIVKSFIIDHPTKQGKKLQYGVLEGPEHSVYVRGKLTNNNTITLPDYWTGLVHEDTITVNLTPIGRKQDLWVETVTDTTITVGSNNKINCFYTVFAERKDVDKLVTEFDK
jgi:hypothetical protein